MIRNDILLIALCLAFACDREPADATGGPTREPTAGCGDQDQDCDGVLAADDCDDTDANLGDARDDADCDGALLDVDCDDDDPSVGAITEDADCDGYPADVDCDDADPAVYPGARDGLFTDMGCDGVVGYLGEADIVLDGQQPDDVMGRALASGDIDGDGLSDVLIAASGNDDGDRNGGKVYLLPGSLLAPGTTLAQAPLSFVGDESDNLGGAVAAGDIDADGLDDVLIGASRDSFGFGGAFLFLAANLPPSGTLDHDTADFWFPSVTSGDAAGSSVALGADATGDGAPDLLVGAESFDGPASHSGVSIPFGRHVPRVRLGPADPGSPGSGGSRRRSGGRSPVRPRRQSSSLRRGRQRRRDRGRHPGLAEPLAERRQGVDRSWRVAPWGCPRSGVGGPCPRRRDGRRRRRVQRRRDR